MVNMVRTDNKDQDGKEVHECTCKDRLGLGKLCQGTCHGRRFIQGGSRVRIMDDQVHRFLRQRALTCFVGPVFGMGY